MTRSIRSLVIGAAVGGAAMLAGLAIADAQEGGDAAAILKSMSDYMAGQKAIALSFNSDIEVITPELQKIQFDSSGRLEMMRPDRLHATRTGGYADVEMMFDGKTFAVDDKKDNVFLVAEAPGTIDQIIAKIRNELGVDMPGADLLLANPYEALSADVLDAKHIGRGVVGGVECEHLAFRNADTDWQLWVAVGAKPIPRKLVITSKAVTAAPQYTLLITEWKDDPQLAADAFSFKARSGAKKVEPKDLPPIDEVPPGVTSGGK